MLPAGGVDAGVSRLHLAGPYTIDIARNRPEGAVPCMMHRLYLSPIT